MFPADALEHRLANIKLLCSLLDWKVKNSSQVAEGNFCRAFLHNNRHNGQLGFVTPLIMFHVFSAHLVNAVRPCPTAEKWHQCRCLHLHGLQDEKKA